MADPQIPIVKELRRCPITYPEDTSPPYQHLSMDLSDRIESLIRELVGALEAAEWSAENHTHERICPLCMRPNTDNLHAGDCVIGAALAHAKGGADG